MLGVCLASWYRSVNGKRQRQAADAAADNDDVHYSWPSIADSASAARSRPRSSTTAVIPSQTGVNIRAFPALLQDWREAWIATSSLGSPNDGRGADLSDWSRGVSQIVGRETGHDVTT
jgi:hypothetical protein